MAARVKSPAPHDKTIVIVAKPRKIWKALTDLKELERWYLRPVEGRFRKGESVNFTWAEREDPGLFYEHIMEVKSPRRLVHTFRFAEDACRPTLCRWDIVPNGATTKVRLVHSGWSPRNAKIRSGTDGGWDWFLSNLKTYLETGKRMPAK